MKTQSIEVLRLKPGAGQYIVLHATLTARDFLFRLRELTFTWPRSGELRTKKLKSYLVRTQGLNVLPLKPGVGQYIAMHAALAAGDFFLTFFFPSCPFTCFFFPTIYPDFFCWLWLTHGSCVGLQNKGHLAGGRFAY